MKILFGIVAAILFVGMIGDRDADDRRNFTFAFVATIAGIIALYALGV